MPASSKALANMSKNLTSEERSAREDAEAETLPDRHAVVLTPPPYIRHGDAKALKYWNGILERMEGVSLLDDLDTEVLGVYCSMLSRRDLAQAMFKRLSKQAKDKGLSADEAIEITTKLGNLLKQLQSQERIILQYADKLGLTPSGRINIARRKAANVANLDPPDMDLFGD